MSPCFGKGVSKVQIQLSFMNSPDFSFSETTDQIFHPHVNFSNSIIFR